jgi:hypothetical protein
MTETHRLPMRLGSLVAEWLLGTQLAEKTLPSLRLGNGAGSALSPGAVFDLFNLDPDTGGTFTVPDSFPG